MGFMAFGGVNVAIPNGSSMDLLADPNGSEESMNGLLLFSAVLGASLGGRAGGGASTGVTWAMGVTGAGLESRARGSKSSSWMSSKVKLSMVNPKSSLDSSRQMSEFSVLLGVLLVSVLVVVTTPLSSLSSLSSEVET